MTEIAQKIIGSIQDRYDRVSVIRGSIALFCALLICVGSIFFSLNDSAYTAYQPDLRFSHGLFVDGILNTQCAKKTLTLIDSHDLIDGCVVATQKNSTAHFILDNDVELRLAAESSVGIHTRNGDLLVLESKSPQGRVWLGNSVSNMQVSFVINGVHIHNMQASTGIEWNTQSVTISSFDGISTVDLYNGTFDINSQKNVFLASLPIPPQYQLDVVFSRINADTQKLYYSKLIKEFPLTTITQDDILASEFMSSHLDHDRLQRLSKRNSVKAYFKTVIASAAFDVSNDFIHDMLDAVTFSPKKAEQRFINRFDFLVSSIGEAYLLKNTALAQSLSTQLVNEINSYRSHTISDQLKLQLTKKVDLWNALLLSSVEDDDLELFAEQFDVISQQTGLQKQTELITHAQGLLAQLFRAAENNQNKAQKKLMILNDFIEQQLEILPNNFYQNNLSEIKSLRNMLWTVLYRYPFFYDTQSVSGLVILNDHILDSISTEELSNEEKQTIIQNYLRILAKMSYSIKHSDPTIDRDAVFTLAEQLLTKIDEFELTTSTDSAVIEFFNDQKQHFIQEFAFLRSDTFEKMARSDFDEVRYEQVLTDFVRMQAEQDKIKELIGEKKVSLNEDQFTLSTDEARTIAKRILESNGMSYSALEPNEDNPRMVTVINGAQNLITFKGVLDIRTEFIFNLEIEGTAIASGISIADLPDLLVSAKKIIESERSQILDTATNSSQPDVLQQGSVLDEILKELAIKRLSSLDFVLSLESIDVVDGLQEVVSVHDINWSDTQLAVSFHYTLKKGLFTQLVIDGQDFDGVYTFEEFKQLIFEQAGSV